MTCADGPSRSITGVGFSGESGAVPENPVTTASPDTRTGPDCATAFPAIIPVASATPQMSVNLSLLIFLVSSRLQAMKSILHRSETKLPELKLFSCVLEHTGVVLKKRAVTAKTRIDWPSVYSLANFLD
jgi:hypothetical protein